jgi:glutathione S-transferase
MRLYLHPFSSNARRVHLTAVELGLEPDIVIVDLAKGEQRSPEFLRRNPAGQVPVLDDEGFVLTESHAIMQYLADAPGGEDLYPTARQPRADVNRWLFWNAYHFQPGVGVLNWENMVKPMLGRGAADPVEVARGTAAVTRLGDLLNQQLAGKTWLAQDRFTLADIAVATTLMTRQPAKLPVGDFGHVLSWLERVQQRASWQATAGAPR